MPIAKPHAARSKHTCSGHDNLFVCDGSIHLTNGGFNPVLTIMALAFRYAKQIAASL
jgi:choline dehydrogenase-like flavoprotein